MLSSELKQLIANQVAIKMSKNKNPFDELTEIIFTYGQTGAIVTKLEFDYFYQITNGGDKSGLSNEMFKCVKMLYQAIIHLYEDPNPKCRSEFDQVLHNINCCLDVSSLDLLKPSPFYEYSFEDVFIYVNAISLYAKVCLFFEDFNAAKTLFKHCFEILSKDCIKHLKPNHRLILVPKFWDCLKIEYIDANKIGKERLNDLYKNIDIFFEFLCCCGSFHEIIDIDIAKTYAAKLVVSYKSNDVLQALQFAKLAEDSLEKLLKYEEFYQSEKEEIIDLLVLVKYTILVLNDNLESISSAHELANHKKALNKLELKKGKLLYSPKIQTCIDIVSSIDSLLCLNSDGTVTAISGRVFHNQKHNVDSWENIERIFAGYWSFAGISKEGRLYYDGSNNLGKGNIASWTDIRDIKFGTNHTLGLKNDGTVVAVGSNRTGCCDVSEWTNIIKIDCRSDSIGLKKDGTVVFTKNKYVSNMYPGLDAWKDIVDISMGDNHIVGLDRKGNVFSTGGNDFGQCNTQNWTDVVKIYSAGDITIGLKSNGTALFAGVVSSSRVNVGIEKINDIEEIFLSYSGSPAFLIRLSNGRLISNSLSILDSIDLIKTNNAVKTCIGDDFVVVLNRDGSLSCCGNIPQTNYLVDEDRLMMLASDNTSLLALYKNGLVKNYELHAQVQTLDWKDIVSIDMNLGLSVGLKKDGTVLSSNSYKRLGWGDISQFSKSDFNSWANIVKVKLGNRFALGLKSDGTVVATGNNQDGQCNVNFWEDIIDICASEFSMGLRANKTVAFTGVGKNHNLNSISSWENIVSIACTQGVAIGLKTDGNIEISGRIDEDNYIDIIKNKTIWSNISKISSSKSHFVALKMDGTVISTNHSSTSIRNFNNITDIDASGQYTIAYQNNE